MVYCCHLIRFISQIIEEKELCEVFIEDTDRQELVCENLLKKENIGIEELLSGEDKENMGLPEIEMPVVRLELVAELARRLNEKMDLMQFELGALEESGIYLFEQGERLANSVSFRCFKLNTGG